MSDNINYSNFSLNGLSKPSNLNPTAQFIWDSTISPSGAFRPLKTSDTGGEGSASATNNSGPRTSGNALDSNVSRKSLLIYPNTANPIYVQVQNASGTWFDAVPAITQGNAYYDDEYRGAVKVTGTSLNYTVIEY